MTRLKRRRTAFESGAMAEEGEHLSHDGDVGEVGDVCMVYKSFRSMSMAELKAEMAGHGKNGKLREYKRRRDCVGFLRWVGRAKFVCRENEPNSCGLHDELWSVVANKLAKRDITALAALARLGKTCRQLRRVAQKSGLWAWMVAFLIEGAKVADDNRSAVLSTGLRLSYDVCEEVVRAVEFMVPPWIFWAAITASEDWRNLERLDPCHEVPGSYVPTPPDKLLQWSKLVCTLPILNADREGFLSRRCPWEIDHPITTVYGVWVPRLLRKAFSRSRSFRKAHGIQDLLREFVKRRDVIDRKFWFEKVHWQLGINRPDDCRGGKLSDWDVWNKRVLPRYRFWLQEAVSPQGCGTGRHYFGRRIERTGSALDRVIRATENGAAVAEPAGVQPQPAGRRDEQERPRSPPIAVPDFRTTPQSSYARPQPAGRRDEQERPRSQPIAVPDFRTTLLSCYARVL